MDLLHSFQNEANLAKSNFETLKAETDVLKNNFKIDEDNKNKMILKMEEELEKYKNYGKSLVDNLQEAKSSLEVTGNQLKQKEVEIGNLKKLLDREKNSASEQDSTVNTLLETNGQLNQKIQEFTAKVETLQKSLASSNSTNEQLTTKTSQLEQENQNLALQLSEFNQNTLHQTESLTEYEAEIESLCSDLKNKDKKLNFLKNENENYTQSLAKLKSNLKKSETENNSLIKSIKNLNGQIEQISQENDSHKSQLADTEKLLVEANHNLKNSTKNLREQLKNDRNSLREQIKIERNLADQARNELIQNREKLQNLEAELIQEKTHKMEWKNETLKLRDELSTLTKTATDTKTTLFELAKEQQKYHLEKQSKENITWQSDANCKNCSHCGIEFSLLTRKHHCRACGKIFCHGCTPHKIELPGILSKELQRVCESCRIKI